PLPHISANVRKPVPIRRIGTHGRRSPRIAHMRLLSSFSTTAAAVVRVVSGQSHPCIAPRELLFFNSAPRSSLPFCLGRQTFACGFAVGVRLVPGHVVNRLPLF